MAVDYALMGALICARRKALHMTQAQLAEQAGVSVAFVGHIERGSRIPSLATIAAIAAAMNVTVDALLPRENDAKPQVYRPDVAHARRLLALALRLSDMDAPAEK